MSKKQTPIKFYSKKIQRKKKEETNLELFRKAKSPKPSISFFIDPFNCHRIYHDFLIPNREFTSGEPIHHFKSYLTYKSLSQVHIRENGIVLQLDDYIPSYITPMGLLKNRLNSIGNKHCHELAEYLPTFFEHFERDKDAKDSIIIKSIEIDPLITKASTYGVLLKEIDEIYQKHLEDVVLITLLENLNGDDKRLILLGFNKGLINFMGSEHQMEKMFENELLEQLLQMFSYFLLIIIWKI